MRLKTFDQTDLPLCYQCGSQEMKEKKVCETTMYCKTLSSHFRVKVFETAFETYPQFIVGLFIWQGLQIQNTKNLVSVSFSAISAVYGFGDLIAYHVNGNEARAPLSWTGFFQDPNFLVYILSWTGMNKVLEESIHFIICPNWHL